MNALILGGGSPRHQAWVRDLAKAAKPYFNQVLFLDYLHWTSSVEQADVSTEVGRAAELTTKLSDYIIIAKSIGTVIATLGVAAGTLTPRRCILLGIPIEAARRYAVSPERLLQLPPTIVIQNEHDPYASAAEVAAYLDVHGNDHLRLVAVPGDTHDYLDFAAIIDATRS